MFREVVPLKHLLHAVLALVLMLSFFYCSPSPDPEAFVAKILRNPTASQAAFPGHQVPLALELKQRIQAASTLRDLFIPAWFVKFENHPNGTVGRIDDAVFNGTHWFLLDGLQDEIFQFTSVGSFVKRLASRGDGPGEYLEPLSIHLIHNQQIAVSDRGKLLLFDAEGTYLQTLMLKDAHRWYLPYYGLIWDTPEQMFLGDFVSSPFDVDSPLHVILNRQGDAWVPTFGFGQRFALMEEANKHGVPIWAHKAFAKVGNTVWSGSPYEATLEVYDLDGRFIGNPQRPVLNPLTRDDFLDQGLNQKKIQELRVEKVHNENLFPVADMVLVYSVGQWGQHSQSYDLFDQNGNFLVGGIHEDNPYTFVISSFDSYIVSQFPVMESLEAYQAALTQEEQALLIASGWNPENFVSDNPYLVIGQWIGTHHKGQP